MKKVFVFAVFVAVLAVSCQKNENLANEQKPAGVPMTLIANIGNATKITYEPNGNALKADWEATETISVVTLTGDQGSLVSIDNFTSTGAAGRTTAEFTGTYTGGATPARVIVIYPALEDNGAGKYYTAPYTDWEGNNQSYLGDINDVYFSFSRNRPLKQVADNDASHLHNYCVLTGEVDKTDIASNKLTVDLVNLMTVLKIVATFPDALKGCTLEKINVTAYNSSDVEAGFCRGNSWEYLDICHTPIYSPGSGASTNKDLHANIVIPASGVVTLYLADPKFSDKASGDKWKFIAQVDGVEHGPATKVFTSDASFDRGRVYRLSVTIPE